MEANNIFPFNLFRSCAVALIVTICLAASVGVAQDSMPEGDSVESHLRGAVEYFVDEVSSGGGYLWQYSEDLSLREGENRADANTVWVQPPGTPYIGRVLLKAWRVTGDEYYLQAAHEAGKCLVRGQLESGGWTYLIYLDDERRPAYVYRVEEPLSRKGRNMSTLDDNTTQCALAFLIELDRELKFSDPAIHESVMFGLDRLLAVQRPNGGWPQGFDAPCEPGQWPKLKANYPPEGMGPSRIKEYWYLYTLNDNLIPDITFTLLLAHKVYGEDRYLESVKRTGDFLLSAQMPDPQPAWAQQYDPMMRPTWARKFEPGSVTGGESQGVMRALMTLYIETGDKKYLEPIPRAITYLRESLLEDGRLARFYELRTNRPLYFTKDYQLTHSDADMPTHYSFKISSDLDAIEAAYDRVTALSDDAVSLQREKRWAYLDVTPQSLSTVSSGAKAAAARVIAQLDEQNRWVEEGSMSGAGPQKIISCRRFGQNVETLLKAIGPKE